MSELNIVFAEPKLEPCACCGGQTTQLTRVVQRDGVPCALYYAMFNDKHTEKHVTAIMSIGDFTEGSGPADRQAFALILRRDEQGVRMVLQDATQSPWQNVDLLGRMLTKAEATDHPQRDEVFEIGAHAIKHDATLFAHFAHSGGCAGCKQPCGS